MKKMSFLPIGTVVFLLAFTACTEELTEVQSSTLKQIVMTTQDFQPEADGRTVYQVADGAVKCTWAENDTVGVFPSEGAQAYFPMASGAGTKNATFDGKGWALKDGYTYASYYPYIGKAYLDRNAVPVSYTGQTQVGNGSMAHLGDYDYMVATPTAPEFGSAQFMFKHLSALVQLKITVPQPATFTSVKLVTDTEAFAVKGKVDVMMHGKQVATIELRDPIQIPSLAKTKVLIPLRFTTTNSLTLQRVLRHLIDDRGLGTTISYRIRAGVKVLKFNFSEKNVAVSQILDNFALSNDSLRQLIELI